MDANRFDTLARSLSASGSRRRALALAISGAFTHLLTRDDAEAHDLLKKCKKIKDKTKKKKCVKKAKAHNATHTTDGGDGGGTGVVPAQRVAARDPGSARIRAIPVRLRPVLMASAARRTGKLASPVTTGSSATAPRRVTGMGTASPERRLHVMTGLPAPTIRAMQLRTAAPTR